MGVFDYLDMRCFISKYLSSPAKSHCLDMNLKIKTNHVAHFVSYFFTYLCL